MSDKTKKIIYFSLLFILGAAFVILYNLDKTIETDGQSIVDVATKWIPVDEDTQTNTAESDSLDSENYYKNETVTPFKYDLDDISEIKVTSDYYNYTLSQEKAKNWMYVSENLTCNVKRNNNSLNKLRNILFNIKADNYGTKDYSDYSRYFEKPLLTAKLTFKDKSTHTLQFIRIEDQVRHMADSGKRTYVRVDDDTVIYFIVYSNVQRFMITDELINK